VGAGKYSQVSLRAGGRPGRTVKGDEVSPFFPDRGPNPPEHPPYWCRNCGAWFRIRRGMENVSCCVAHGEGDCCHFNEEKVEITAPSRGS